MAKRASKKAGRQGVRGQRPPLHGLVVIDASRVLAGPFCAQLLGDLGATVIKIEQPGVGDETRAWGPPFVDGMSAYFMSCNRNKLSVTIDLATKDGREVFQRLLARANVLLENFRAQNLERLGMSTQALRRRFPKLVICSISGFGRDSTWADVPGYDFAIQALSGLMAVTGEPDGEPMKTSVAIADVITGLYAATAILAFLRAAPKSQRRGTYIDMALMDCAVAAQVNLAQAFLATGKQPTRQGNAHLQIVPYQLFKTSDAWLVLTIGNDGQWQRFIKAAGAESLLDQEAYSINQRRVMHREKLTAAVANLMRSRSTATWLTLLREATIPCAPIWTYAEVFASDLAGQRGWYQSVEHEGVGTLKLLSHPFHADALPVADAARLPPRLGEHTEQVLSKFARLSARQIAALRANGAI